LQCLIIFMPSGICATSSSKSTTGRRTPAHTGLAAIVLRAALPDTLQGKAGEPERDDGPALRVIKEGVDIEQITAVFD